MIPDAQFIAGIEAIREKAMDALAKRHAKVTVTFSPLGLLTLLDEIQDRNPRNYTALVRDDTIGRLNAAIDRMEGLAMLTAMTLAADRVA